ncbi:MAG: tetratricopeptide repeat protein [Chlamydiales bacterium]
MQCHAASSSEGISTIKELNRLFCTKQMTPEEYIAQLSQQEENDEAQATLYNVLSKGFLTIPKDAKRAKSLLDQAIRTQRSWYLWMKANESRQNDQPTRYDYILADRMHRDAFDIVCLSPNYQNSLSFIQSVTSTELNKLNKKQIDKFVIKWTRISFGLPLYELSIALQEKREKKWSRELLVKALDLGCTAAVPMAILLAQKYRHQPHRHSQAYSIFEQTLKLAPYHLAEDYSKFSSSICSHLGLMNLDGYADHASDPISALSFFLRIKNPDFIDCDTLVSNYQNVKGEERVIKYLRQLAEKDHVLAMNSLSELLRSRTTTREEALFWMLKAAEKGHPQAMCNLGEFYEQEGDTAKSNEWHLKGAEAGHPTSIVRMTFELMLNNNFQEARYWLAKAKLLQEEIETTLSDGTKLSLYLRTDLTAFIHNTSGLIHELGDKNEELALSCYEQSAALNDPFGLNRAGRLLFKHPEGHKRAIDYFIKAAHAGDVGAMMNLVHICLSSSEDEHRKWGKFWLERANALGDENAKKYLYELDVEESKIEEVIEHAERRIEPTFVNEREVDEEEMLKIPQPAASFSLSEPGPGREEEIYPSYSSSYNPTLIRRNLIDLKAARQAEQEQRTLAPRSQQIARKMLSKEHVSLNELFRFFEDPVFERHIVKLSPTRNGLMIDAINNMTGQRDCTSTHRIHGKNKPEAFRHRLCKLLQEVFPDYS